MRKKLSNKFATEHPCWRMYTMYKIFSSLKEISHDQHCFLLYTEKKTRLVMTDFLQGTERRKQCWSWRISFKELKKENNVGRDWFPSRNWKKKTMLVVTDFLQGTERRKQCWSWLISFKELKEENNVGRDWFPSRTEDFVHCLILLLIQYLLYKFSFDLSHNNDWKVTINILNFKLTEYISSQT
jgi:hypothetical protein